MDCPNTSEIILVVISQFCSIKKFETSEQSPEFFATKSRWKKYWDEKNKVMCFMEISQCPQWHKVNKNKFIVIEAKVRFMTNHLDKQTHWG